MSTYKVPQSDYFDARESIVRMLDGQFIKDDVGLLLDLCYQSSTDNNVEASEVLSELLPKALTAFPKDFIYEYSCLGEEEKKAVDFYLREMPEDVDILSIIDIGSKFPKSLSTMNLLSLLYENISRSSRSKRIDCGSLSNNDICIDYYTYHSHAGLPPSSRSSCFNDYFETVCFITNNSKVDYYTWISDLTIEPVNSSIKDVSALRSSLNRCGFIKKISPGESFKCILLSDSIDDIPIYKRIILVRKLVFEDLFPDVNIDSILLHSPTYTSSLIP